MRLKWAFWDILGQLGSYWDILGQFGRLFEEFIAFSSTIGLFKKTRDRRTDPRTDGQTDPLIEMRGRI